jgi:hypothetical protein
MILSCESIKIELQERTCVAHGVDTRITCTTNLLQHLLLCVRARYTGKMDMNLSLYNMTKYAIF